MPRPPGAAIPPCWSSSTGLPCSTTRCASSRCSATRRGRGVNELSKEVGQLRRDGDVAAAEAKQAESRAVGEEERALGDELDGVSAALRDLLLGFPNLIHPEVPDGESDRDNVVVHGPFGLPTEFAVPQQVPHWESGPALGILDNERAIKMSGAMFAMTRGLGATLGRALCQLALDRNATTSRSSGPRRWCRRRR